MLATLSSGVTVENNIAIATLAVAASLIANCERIFTRLAL